MYDANAALRHALGVALPALRHDQIEAAAIRLVEHPAFIEALMLALEDNDWGDDDARIIATEIKAALAPPTATNFNPRAGMETR